MSAESTRQVLQRYVDSKHTDMSVMADDDVFTNMTSGLGASPPVPKA